MNSNQNYANHILLDVELIENILHEIQCKLNEDERVKIIDEIEVIQGAINNTYYSLKKIR